MTDLQVIAGSTLTEGANLFPLHVIGMFFGCLGLVFFLGSAVGLIRFPDFYSRMHAAGKGDTLSTMLMLIGFGLVTMDDFSLGSWLVFIKIMGVVLFIFIASPTVSHVLMRAASEDDEITLMDGNSKKSKGKREDSN